MAAAVLHMGKISFAPDGGANSEGSVVGDPAALRMVCELVSLDEAAFVHALCHRQLHTMAPGGKVETYEVPLNPTQAAAARDAVSKVSSYILCIYTPTRGLPD